jgi:hypothetical protein
MKIYLFYCVIEKVLYEKKSRVKFKEKDVELIEIILL